MDTARRSAAQSDERPVLTGPCRSRPRPCSSPATPPRALFLDGETLHSTPVMPFQSIGIARRVGRVGLKKPGELRIAGSTCSIADPAPARTLCASTRAWPETPAGRGVATTTSPGSRRPRPRRSCSRGGPLSWRLSWPTAAPQAPDGVLRRRNGCAGRCEHRSVPPSARELGALCPLFTRQTRSFSGHAPGPK